MEKELKSWAPRLPSAGIKRRLFPDEQPHLDWHRVFAGLAGLAACVALTLSVISHETAAETYRPGPLAAMAWSNQAPPSYQLPDTAQSENRVNRATLAWTNPGHFSSIVGFTRDTN